MKTPLYVFSPHYCRLLRRFNTSQIDREKTKRKASEPIIILPLPPLASRPYVRAYSI